LAEAIDMAVDAASRWLLDAVENNEQILHLQILKTSLQINMKMAL